MILSYRGLLTLVSLLALAVSASAASFRPHATVVGGQITLGDLFDGAGAVAGTVVARAPDPGQRMIFAANSLAALARTYGLDWRPASPRDRTVVERSAILVGGDRIEGLVRDYLVAKGVKPPFAVLFDKRSIQMELPTNSGPASIKEMTFDPEQARFSGMLVASVPEGELSIPVSGRTVGVVQIPVLNRSLDPGELVGAADVDLVPIQRDRIAPDAITDPAKVIGRAAARILAPDRPLRLADLQRDLVVKRGQTVTIMLDDPQMELTTEGRALTDGAKGDPVKVINVSTSRVVEGLAAGLNLVAVSDSAPSISNQGDAQ